MSIRIDGNRCIGCFKCISVCPGSLIYSDDNNKAYIKYERNCWGCTACIKECPRGAIRYYLGADIGGRGSFLYTGQNGDELNWYIEDKGNNKIVLVTNRTQSNKY
ncbi:MAG: ferredoxin family protein [Clostridium sp.]|jgi:adenylylsulfate reductase subunit B|uniref:4Fe-4S dicluster domain-containing protein n=1 Tax=Clostridium sp. TaxID=1506 RepID=UPI0025C16453|nr:ferredoxin family protein [Clostridium sp.]MCH3963203.1 ferredoxin family protein [Clostridium sp.]MCI1716334.1 ferredoxin family protein [Clostridium sp.]MCI1800674.1 ferredoxin family protein [Clostridium sp.]MCI1814671.1 ferredoxin family protein [Clostridium sp.]MCI1871581.1 ferredoxin family protein [Clostridium sp.]